MKNSKSFKLVMATLCAALAFACGKDPIISTGDSSNSDISSAGQSSENSNTNTNDVTSSGGVSVVDSSGTNSQNSSGTNNNSNTTSSQTKVEVASVTLNQEDLTLDDNDSPVQLTYVLMPENATDKRVNWLSSVPAVATISASGLLTPVAAGSTVITVKSVDNTSKLDTLTVTVNSSYISATSVVINDKSVTTLIVSETLSLSATVHPDNATNKNVLWDSSDTSVATVSNGLVTALKAGSVTITAKHAANYTVKDTLAVTVSYVPVQSIAINQGATLSLEQGRYQQLSATVSPSGALQEVSWSSADDTKVSVSQTGLIQAHVAGVGSVTKIFATADADTSKIAEIDVSVIAQKEVSSATILPSHFVANAGYKDGSQTIRNDRRQNFTFDYTQVLRSNDGKIQIDNGKQGGISNIVSDDISLPIRKMIVNHSTGGTNFVVSGGASKTNMTAITPEIDNKAYIYDFPSDALFYSFVVTTPTTYLNSIEVIYDYDGIVTPATSISIAPGDSNIIVDGTVQLNAEVAPYEASQAVNWQSSDTSVATVDNNGLVTGVTAGTATITATSVDYPLVLSTVNITVESEDNYTDIDAFTLEGKHFGAYADTSKQITNDGFTLNLAIKDVMNNSGIQFKSGAGVMQTTNDNIIIKKIVLTTTTSSNSGTLNYWFNNTSTFSGAATSQTIASNKTYTIDFSTATGGGYKYIKLSSSTGAFVFTSIKLDLKVSGSTTTPGEDGGDDVDPAIFASFDFGKFSGDKTAANTTDTKTTLSSCLETGQSPSFTVTTATRVNFVDADNIMRLGNGTTKDGILTLTFTGVTISKIVLVSYSHTGSTKTIVNSVEKANAASSALTTHTFDNINSNVITFTNSGERVSFKSIAFYIA